MADGTYIATALAVAVAITFALRAAPFALKAALRDSGLVTDIGRWMPLGAVSILAVYCLSSIDVSGAARHIGCCELRSLRMDLDEIGIGDALGTDYFHLKEQMTAPAGGLPRADERVRPHRGTPDHHRLLGKSRVPVAADREARPGRDHR